MSHSAQIGILVHELLVGWRESGSNDREHPGLWSLIAVQLEPVRMSDRDSTHRKVSGSPAPWAADMGGLLTDIAAGARSLEKRLAWELCVPRPPRGGSDMNTHRALRNLVDFTAAVEVRHPESDLPELVEREVSSWHRTARLLLGISQRWARVPIPCPAVGEDGETCGAEALRQNPRDGSVRCGSCQTVWPESELGWLGRLAEGA